MPWFVRPFDPNERAVRRLRSRESATVRMYTSPDPEAIYAVRRRAIASSEARGRFLLAAIIVGCAVLVWP
jgi:hypothetical protein